MSGQKVADKLRECCRCVTEGVVGSLEEAQREFTACREALSDELVTLLQDAADMKWPFVPEKWQYKNSLTSEDKVNLKDLISENLPQLLAYLRAAILAGQPLWASSAIFLVDRFLYWTDDSRQLLRIARKLHQRYGDTPIAPQVVIRQARVYFSTGKLQKAEYILGSLISNSGSTGCWKYHSDSDRILVQAVSVQVRGQVLQKLGLWFEAAELICASLVGFYSLPQPDKKGIGTSLGILANILVSMDDEDFRRLMTSEDSHMSFFRKIQHRLPSAAEAAKMAVIYSQYASLYVLTNVVTQGTCLLSYSFSAQCPPSGKATFLTQAKEAFEIGLLTKTEEDVVTSKQELHTFVKAAYALAITHKWLGSPHSLVTEALLLCREASAMYYSYCFDEKADRDKLCKDVMRLVQNVKSLLKVEPFENSDPGSFIPDTYRAAEDRTVVFTTDDFAKVMEKFQQHHQSVCEASKASCHRHDSVDGCGDGKSTPGGLCVTSFGTATEMANTECATESQVHTGPPGVQQGGKKDMASFCKPPTQQPTGLPRNHEHTQTETSDEEEQKHVGGNEKAKFSSSSLSSSLGSSWGIMTSSSRGSSQTPKTPNVQVDPCCPTEGDTDDLDCLALGSSAASMAKAGSDIKDRHRGDASKNSHPSQQPSHMQTEREGNRSHSMRSSKQSIPSSVAGQSSIETEDDESDMQKLQNHLSKVTIQGNKEGSFSSSLSSSFGSLSSFPKVPSLEKQSSIDDDHPIVRGSQVPTKANDGKAQSSSTPCNSSGQKGGKGTKDNTIPASRQTISKTGSDQMSIETEDDPGSLDLSHTSQGFKGSTHGNKERTSSSSFSSSFGSLSPWPKVPSTGSSVDDSQEAVGGNDISTKQAHKECQKLSLESNWSGQKGAESHNKDNSIPVTTTAPRSIPDQRSEETEDEPDDANLGIIQGSKERPLSSSFSSSFGSSSSWQKVPSLDTLSSHSGSGLRGGNVVLPTHQEGKSVKEHHGDTHGPTKPTFPSERLETKPAQGGLQKSDGVDSAERGADIVSPVTHSSNAQNATELKNGSSLTSSLCPRDATCNKCFPSHLAELGVLDDILTRQDYSALFAGVCHECLISRLPKKTIPSLPNNKAYGALLLKFSKATGLWTGRETNLYMGKYLQKGSQREAFLVQFLHQEELLGSYVGKQYHKFEAAVHDHLNDVERQVTAQYYVTEFNKRLYEKNIVAQIFFIPSEVLLILERDTIVGCVTAEPYILGTFDKLTNNTKTVIKKNEAFQYGIAFGHFTYEYSRGEEVVVDLQGWVTEKGEGLTYLTDPQIHTLRKKKNKTSNFHQRGINLFLEEQHGPECNMICKNLCLGKLQMPKH